MREEKVFFGNFLGGNLPQITAQRIQLMMPMVESAGLADLEASWLNQLLAANPGQPAQQLVDLQQRRLRYDELGAQLEAYWKVFPADGQSNRDALLTQAAENYRLAENVTAEVRLLGQMDQRGLLSGPLVARFAGLVAAREPQRFIAVTLSDRSENVRNAFADYAIENGSAARALETIAARGRGLPLVWTRAYTSLTGLYFANPTPQVNAAFKDLLGSGTIGERIGKPVDRNLQLAGEGWFYYGARYCEDLHPVQTGASAVLPPPARERAAAPHRAIL